MKIPASVVSGLGPTRMPRILSPLLLLLLLSTAVAQPPSGLLYWCSAREGGTNFEASGPGGTAAGQPRSVWLVANASSPAPPTFSAPCHMGPLLAAGSTASVPLQSDGRAYVLSNTSSYPPNNPDSPFGINPSSCLVSAATSFLPSGYVSLLSCLVILFPSFFLTRCPSLPADCGQLGH